MIPAFMSFGLGEMLVVAVIALLVFGGNLPDVMRTFGQTYAKFRRAMHEFTRPVREEMRDLTRLPNEAPVSRDADVDKTNVDRAALSDTDHDGADNGEHAVANTWLSEAATDIGVADSAVPASPVPEKALPPPEDDFDEPPPV